LDGAPSAGGGLSGSPGIIIDRGYVREALRPYATMLQGERALDDR
jgi:hypothetical protein